MLKNMLMISAIVSPMAELFPEYGLSYWLPRNSDKKFYDDRILARVYAVIIVWIPILTALYKISPSKAFLVAVLIMSAFYTRAMTMYEQKKNISGALYGLGFIVILITLGDIRNILPLITIMIGGSLIRRGRTGDKRIDYIGRIIFALGFIWFICVLIKKLESKDVNWYN